MSRTRHNLPSNLAPIGDICVPIYIPNDPEYIRLVTRALRVLTLDRHYQRDDNHSAIIVRDIFDTRMYQPFIEELENGGCMTPEEFCEAVENCLASSATIEAIQLGISNNSSAIIQNAIGIVDNADDIISLQNDNFIHANAITSLQTSDIAIQNDIIDINTELNNKQTQINALIVAVGDNANDIVGNTNDISDHETRITALENASSGANPPFTTKSVFVRELLGTSTLLFDALDFSQFSIPQEKSYTHLEIYLRAKNTGSANNVYIFFNNDIMLTNYRSLNPDGSDIDASAIGRLPSNVDVDMWTDTRIIIPYPQSAVNKTAQSLSIARNNDTGVSLGGSYHVVWENDAAIETVHFGAASGMLVAGSSFEVYGYVQQEIVVPIGEWQAVFDFSIEDYDEIFTPESTTEYSSGRYQSNDNSFERARIFLATSSEWHLVSVEMDYFVDSTDILTPTAQVTESGLFNHQEALPVSDMIATISVAVDEDTDNTGFMIQQNPSAEAVGGRARLHKLTITGSGAIPTELQPYVT